MSWRVSLPCTRAEAEAIDVAEALPVEAALATSATAAGWRLDAYVEAPPGAALIAELRALAPSAAAAAPAIERLDEQDWVALSQAGLEPLHVGRFHVHTPATLSGAAAEPAGHRRLVIDAGRAFGTGHHETTGGCLAMLDALAGRPVARVLDIGTGTGLLAFAARHLWPAARVVATDIDPVAVAVAADNAALNRVDGIELITADGALDPRIAATAPYDLILANILAGPLVAMAPELAALAAPRATLILAGLLETQREAVAAAYAGCGCAITEVDRRGDWTILRLTAGAEPYAPGAPADSRGRYGWALDF